MSSQEDSWRCPEVSVGVERTGERGRGGGVGGHRCNEERDCYGARQYFKRANLATTFGVPTGGLRRQGVCLHALIDRVSVILAQLGIGSSAFIARLGLRPDANGEVSTAELCQALLRPPAHFTTEEADTLSYALDKGGSGRLVARHLTDTVLGPLPRPRVAAVKALWEKLNPNGLAAVPIATLDACFEPTLHPLAVSRRKSTRALRCEALESFGAAAAAAGDDVLRYEDFEDYFRTNSQSIQCDEAFSELLRETWRPQRLATRGGNGGTGMSTMPNRSKPTRPLTLESSTTSSDGQRHGLHAPQEHLDVTLKVGKLQGTDGLGPRTGYYNVPGPSTRVANRLDVASRNSNDVQFDSYGPVIDGVLRRLRTTGAAKVCTAGRNFRVVDASGNMRIRRAELGKMLQDLGCSDAEGNALWSTFHHDNSGSIDYNELLRAIFGPLDSRRSDLVNELFDQIAEGGVARHEFFAYCDGVSACAGADETLESILARSDRRAPAQPSRGRPARAASLSAHGAGSPKGVANAHGSRDVRAGRSQGLSFR